MRRRIWGRCASGTENAASMGRTWLMVTMPLASLGPTTFALVRLAQAQPTRKWVR